MNALSTALARALLLTAFVAGAATTLSCNVNDYCLNCATGDGGPAGDGGGDASDGGDLDDATDGGPCVPTGAEQCDGIDNDCDLQTDEGTLPGVGDDCTNQTGACAGAKKVCTAGMLVCDKPPMPELCDLVDNNCNGTVDEGDPGGGALCGTNTGECQAGVNRCVSGTVTCVGSVGSVGGVAESCNNRDDDCDGTFDEDVGALGSCTGGTDVGLCELGSLMCVGGAPTCVGRVSPTFELCNNLDEDCDGNNTNGYNLATDPQNCGACGTACALTNAIEGCATGMCTVAACETGFHNNNNMASDGCEFGPCTKQNDTEICNGMDDDCSGAIDDGITLPPSFCINVGQCGAGTEQTVGTDTDADGSVVVCAGALGFQCDYADPDVSTDASGLIQPETLCDGKDNDCDGAVDEGQPNLGQACDNGEVGDCRSSGTYVCDTANLDGAAVCNFTQVAPGTSTETCDGRDNDCNGTIDDGFAAGNLPGQDWVTIPGDGSQIMKYEASRPDATATALGTQQTHVCSRTGAQPWTNITHPQAETACAAIGARLCTEAEWEGMCAQAPASVAGTTVAGPTDATGYVLIEAEQMAVRNGNATVPGSWLSAVIQNFSGASAMRSSPDDNTLSATSGNAPANAPRLRIPVALQAGTYVVWVRMLAPNASGDSVFVGLNATTTTGSVNLGTLTTSTLNTWQWVRDPLTTVTVAAASTQDINVWMGDDGVAVDAVVITRNASTNAPPFDDKIWAYGADPKLPQPMICNGDEYDTDAMAAGDQDGILATGALTSCFANGPTVGTSNGDAFDMSGNVKEWAAERSPGQNPLRGGSANNEVDGLACGLDFTLANDAFFFPNVGFRCCRN